MLLFLAFLPAGVDLYGAGMGYYLQSDQMRMLTSSPSNIFYQTTEDWIRILTEGLVKPNNGKDIGEEYL